MWPLLGRLLGAGLLTEREIAAARIGAGLVPGDLKAGLAIKKLLEESKAADEEKPPAITIPVVSSCIIAIGWNPAGVITVDFKRGGIYTYDGSYEMFVAFAAAESKGHFFNENFRNK